MALLGADLYTLRIVIHVLLGADPNTLRIPIHVLLGADLIYYVSQCMCC